jgi:hypothetical protein
MSVLSLFPQGLPQEAHCTAGLAAPLAGGQLCTADAGPADQQHGGAKAPGEIRSDQWHSDAKAPGEIISDQISSTVVQRLQVRSDQIRSVAQWCKCCRSDQIRSGQQHSGSKAPSDCI